MYAKVDNRLLNSVFMDSAMRTIDFRPFIDCSAQTLTQREIVARGTKFISSKLGGGGTPVLARGSCPCRGDEWVPQSCPGWECPCYGWGYPSPLGYSQEGTWDQSLGYPWNGLGPVEVLWDGDGVPRKYMRPVEVLGDGDGVPSLGRERTDTCDKSTFLIPRMSAVKK